MVTNPLTALVLGTAVTALTVPSPTELAPRAQTTLYENPDGVGNMRLRVFDGRVDTGSCSVDTIMDSLYENCYGEGTCEPGGWEIDCRFDAGGSRKVKITPWDAHYEKWVKNGLIDSLRAALKTEGVTEKKNVWSGTPGGCTGCPPTGDYIDVYKMPSKMFVSHGEDGSNESILAIKITNENSGGGDTCGIISDLGSAIAGAVNGAAGGLFSIFSIICES